MNARVLIVGQGLAGSLLACALRYRGATVHICDAAPVAQTAHAYTVPSSAVAAGIINPITGKRYVKSWRFDVFFETAERTYRALEREWGLSLWHPCALLRLLGSPEESNDWAARSALPDYAAYMDTAVGGEDWSPWLKPGFQIGRIQTARVAFLPLIEQVRAHFGQIGCFSDKVMDEQAVRAQTSSYDWVVLCEGAAARWNPLCADLPWQLAKGEAIWVRFETPIPQLPRNLLKKQILVAPVGEGLYWCGSPYTWQFEDDRPSAEGRAFIEEHLRDMVDVPYEVVRHAAAIRPTVKHRRPLLGRLPGEDRIAIFNGLGTKGALLAPFWAEHLAEHLLEGVELDREVILDFGF